MVMKYFIVEIAPGSERPFIFSDDLSHLDILTSMGYDKSDVVAAGFAAATSKGIICYGESITLRAKSRQERDSNLINRMIEFDL